jgi:NRPS condensation-like uncharacterized protein
MKEETHQKMPTHFRVTMWDRMQFFISKVADQQIRGIIHFEGNLDECLIDKAIRLSLDAEPVPTIYL